MSNNGDRVVPLRITPDEKLDFWLSSLMSGIQLIRAAIGENTLIAFDPNLNPMRVPYLYGGFGLVGPVLSGLAKPWACVYARCEHLATILSYKAQAWPPKLHLPQGLVPG